jgi:2-keto-3-deoxy-L-rhamnonate aldolase RhmA
MASSMYPSCATFKPRVLARAQVKGLFVQLGSAATAELAARAGFDFVVLDQEHGLGGEDVLLQQLVALAGSACFPVVRLAWHEAARFKRALDLGACGIMVPYVDSAEQAAAAAAAMRYPPHGGVRGVAKTTRATNFGAAFDEYWDHALERLLLVVQIETAAGVEAADAIARVDGVDCLFVGPTDLGVSIAGGKPIPFDDARLVAARRRVAEACRAAGKAAGILCGLPEQVAVVREEGFTFVALGSDMGAAAAGIRAFAAALAVPA